MLALCARSAPPRDCELCAPEFLVAMLPFLLATAVISAVCDVLPHAMRKRCTCVTA